MSNTTRIPDTPTAKWIGLIAAGITIVSVFVGLISWLWPDQPPKSPDAIAEWVFGRGGAIQCWDDPNHQYTSHTDLPEDFEPQWIKVAPQNNDDLAFLCRIIENTRVNALTRRAAGRGLPAAGFLGLDGDVVFGERG